MKKLILITGIITAALAGTIYYYWRQVTYLPSWYNNAANQNQTSLNQADLQQKTAEIKSKISTEITQVNKSPEIQLTAGELNDLIREEVQKKTSKNAHIAEVIKGVNTTIKDEQIETGAVVNLAQIPADKLSKREQTALENIKQNFSAFANRDVYVAIQGKPMMRNGRIILDENGTIKVGNMTLTTRQLASKLGLSLPELQNQLNLKLPLDKLQIEQIQIEGEQIKIRGKKSNN